MAKKNIFDQLEKLENECPKKPRDINGEVIITTPTNTTTKKFSSVCDRRTISKQTLPDFYIGS